MIRLGILAVLLQALAGGTLMGADLEFRTCSANDLKGGYGFKIRGTNFAAGQFSFVGQFVSDGNGNLSGSGVEGIQGNIGPANFTGTYSIHSDCTGTVILTLPPSITVHLFFVLVMNGNEALLLDIDNGTDEAGSAKRLFRQKAKGWSK